MPQPQHWQKYRRRFFLFGAFIFALIIFLAVVAGVVGFLLVAHSLGWIDAQTWFTNFYPDPRRGLPIARFPRFAGLLWAIVFFGGISFLINRLVRRVMRPIGQLMDAVARVEQGDYRVRVDERGTREVRALNKSFNGMVAKLQANEDTRRNMLADVTHELRTPLTIIQGNLEGLLDDVYPRDEAHLQPILEESKVMARLIEDLRTMSLAESGNLQLQREPTDVFGLMRDVCASFKAKADAAQVQLNCSAPTNLPTLDVDSVRIREVLTNLLGNALRYTPAAGSILLQAKLEPSYIHVIVKDSGAGIAPELLPHVFDRFYKGRDSMGSGLGLAIAKQLVEAHGGKIFAESVLGVGTTITFLLPTGM